MTTMHPARKRLLLGFLLLSATFFYAFAGTCGLIGELIAHISSKLLGQTGSTLLALTMLVVGLLLVIPHGALGRFFAWAFHGREARVARVVRESDKQMFEAAVRRIVAEAVKVQSNPRGCGTEAADGGAGAVCGENGVLCPDCAPAKPSSSSELSVRERRNLDDVRTAMKQLGYHKNEFEPLVVKMDPRLAPEVLIRDAIKELYAGGRN